MKPIPLIILALVAFGSLDARLSLAAVDEDNAKPVLRVVFFTPADVDPPANVKERLKESVDYAQAFYGRWMKHWDYSSDDPLPVERDPDGSPRVLFVKGRLPEASGRYRQLGFEPEVIEAACRKYNIDRSGQVWWIFTFHGPQRRGFRGGGNAMRGGTSTSIFDPAAPGDLALTTELGSDDVRKNSKASVHELGHALGLPHIGPLEGDKLGNSLMGPVVRAYRSRHPKEDRVYLTEASAVMLWKHPLFSGTAKDRSVTPKVDIRRFDASVSDDGKRFVVKGKVSTDYPAHSVVIANASDADRSDYWRKCFVGRVEEDNSFRVEIDEVTGDSGRLLMVVCFDNGAVVGKDGRGLRTGFAKQYHFNDGKFTFDEGWAANPASQPRRRRVRPN